MMAMAQGPVSFDASTNARQVVLGNHFQVYFTLKNAEGASFKAPSFTDFHKVSGPNSNSTLKAINGQWEKTMTYSYFLQPKKVGKIKIGAASVKVDGKEFKTKPISVEVVKGSNKNMPDQSEEQIFVRAELNSVDAVPGQQILLDYKVYTAINVSRYSIVEEPDYSGFYTSQIRRFNGSQMKEVINGKQYNSKILKRVALYPQQTGEQTIGKMKFRVAIPIDGVNNNNDPFNFIKPTRSYIMETEPVSISVKSLPTPVPESFSGAVGQYVASAALDKPAATTDDALTLQIRVDGEGDIQRVTAPKLILSDSFEVYDPNVVDEQVGERNGSLIGTKVFKYLILPKVPGNFLIRPEFSYYDTDSSKFVKTYPAEFAVNIVKGKYDRNVNVKPVVDNKPKEEIRAIKTSASIQKPSNFVGSILYWILLTLPILAMIGAGVYKYILSQRPDIDPIAIKSERAQRVAKERLAVAETHLKSGNNKEFYSETSKVLLGYAIDKFNIPGSELKKSNVEEKLRQSGAKEEHISRFMDLIRTCEKAVFAFGTDADAKQTYENAVSVIADVEM